MRSFLLKFLTRFVWFRRRQALRTEESLHQAKRLLWESCEKSDGPLAAFGRVADSAIRGIEVTSGPMLNTAEHARGGEPRPQAVPVALDMHATGGLLLEKLSPLTKRLGEKLMEAGRSLLDAVPPTIGVANHGIDDVRCREIALQKPTTLAAALAHAGSSIEAAEIPERTAETLAREYGVDASGEEPRVIAIARHRMPSCIFGGEPDPEPTLRAAHLRGPSNIWWDIPDRLLAWPIGTRIFIAIQ